MAYLFKTIKNGRNKIVLLLLIEERLEGENSALVAQQDLFSFFANSLLRTAHLIKTFLGKELLTLGFS